jgi:hypothetical protein
MSFERQFEPLTVRVGRGGEHVEIEQPGYSGESATTVSVPVHQIPLLIEWLQEAKAEIEALAASARGES